MLQIITYLAVKKGMGHMENKCKLGRSIGAVAVGEKTMK